MGRRGEGGEVLTLSHATLLEGADTTIKLGLKEYATLIIKLK